MFMFMFMFMFKIEKTVFWFDRGFGHSSIFQHNPQIKTTMPSLNVLKDDELKDKEIKNQWKMNFNENDWKKHCINVLKQISPKKYDENELKELMEEIVKEVC